MARHRQFLSLKPRASKFQRWVDDRPTFTRPFADQLDLVVLEHFFEFAADLDGLGIIHRRREGRDAQEREPAIHARSSGLAEHIVNHPRYSRPLGSNVVSYPCAQLVQPVAGPIDRSLELA